MTYGCHNKPRPTEERKYIAQAGWSDTFYDGFGAPHRTPIHIEVKHVMSTTCMYDKSQSDKGCENCQWANKSE